MIIRLQILRLPSIKQENIAADGYLNYPVRQHRCLHRKPKENYKIHLEAILGNIRYYVSDWVLQTEDETHSRITVQNSTDLGWSAPSFLLSLGKGELVESIEKIRKLVQ